MAAARRLEPQRVANPRQGLRKRGSFPALRHNQGTKAGVGKGNALRTGQSVMHESGKGVRQAAQGVRDEIHDGAWNPDRTENDRQETAARDLRR